MTEAEMEAADPADLKQKVDKAKAILSKVTIPGYQQHHHQTEICFWSSAAYNSFFNLGIRFHLLKLSITLT